MGSLAWHVTVFDIHLQSQTPVHGFTILDMMSQPTVLYMNKSKDLVAWYSKMAFLHSQRLRGMSGQQDSHSGAMETGQESKSQRPSARRSCHPVSMLPENLPSIDWPCQPPVHPDRCSPHNPWITEEDFVASWGSNTHVNIEAPSTAKVI